MALQIYFLLAIPTNYVAFLFPSHPNFFIYFKTALWGNWPLSYKNTEGS